MSKKLEMEFPFGVLFSSTFSPALPGWQPIDTAPTDNHRLLYLARFDSQGQLKELTFDGVWQWDNGDGWEYDNGFWCWFSDTLIEEPTHWAYQDEAIPPVTGEVRLWDTQWTNVVNTCKPFPLSDDVEDLVMQAVKMTETYIAQNVANNALPPSKHLKT